MIKTRAALPGDHPNLQDLKERAAWSNAADRAFLAANPHEARQLEDGALWLATLQGQVAGYAAVRLAGAGTAVLDGLFVDPNFMRCGVGMALVRQCADVARGLGATQLLVDPNPQAMAFYTTCGFEVADTAQDKTQLVLRLA